MPYSNLTKYPFIESSKNEVYQVPFNGQGLASGVYYYTLKVRDHSGKTFSQTKRMLLTK